jgi:hypothetical protein
MSAVRRAAAGGVLPTAAAGNRHGLVLSLLNPLHFARTIAVATLGSVRLGGSAVKAAGNLATELVDDAIGVLRGRREDFGAEGYASGVRRVSLRPPAREARQPMPHPAEPTGGERSAGDAVAPMTSPRFAATNASPRECAERDPATRTEAPSQSDDARPEHVSEEATVVAASADRGAEDGAGAEVEVEQPWPGYTKMRALDIIEHLVAEPDAVLSVVLLYEQEHRGRRTVLDAAEHELARRSAAQRRS